MKKFIFNTVVYSSLVYTMLAGIHATLPPEIQIQGFTNLTALVSGGATGLFGTGLLTIQSWLKKREKDTDEKYIEVAKSQLTLTEKYDKMVAEAKETQKKTTAFYDAVNKGQTRIIELLETDLKAKLSNRLIDKEVKERIEGVLDEEKDTI